MSLLAAASLQAQMWGEGFGTWVFGLQCFQGLGLRLWFRCTEELERVSF